MKIENLGPIEPVPNLTPKSKNIKNIPTPSNDSLSVSTEAQNRAEILKAAEIIRSTPEVRQNRINEVREKLKNPAYINEQVLSETADNLMKSFGIKKA